MKTWTRRLSFGFLATGIAIWLSGCLSASYFFMARYDAANDEFHIMNVYEQIAAGTPADSQYLYHLWLNRDCIIRVPNIDIFGKQACLRLSPTRYATINLGQATPKLQTQETAISLGKIRVLPGTFFLRGPDTLCYYDQVVVPGSVVDQALARFPTLIDSSFAEAIDKEVKRRQDGGKRTEWEKLREELRKLIQLKMNPAPVSATAPATAPEEAESNEALSYFDEESLKLLRQGATDGGIKITRDKQIFRFSVPMSNADARQFEQLLRIVVDSIKAAKPDKNAPIAPADALKILEAFAITAQSRAIELKIDLAVILKNLHLLSALAEPLGNPTPEELAKMRVAIADLTAHGVPIDNNITVEQLGRDFLADSLKSYPSEHPIAPGSGLVGGGPAEVRPESAK